MSHCFCNICLWVVILENSSLHSCSHSIKHALVNSNENVVTYILLGAVNYWHISAKFLTSSAINIHLHLNLFTFPKARIFTLWNWKLSGNDLFSMMYGKMLLLCWCPRFFIRENFFDWHSGRETESKTGCFPYFHVFGVTFYGCWVLAQK